MKTNSSMKFLTIIFCFCATTVMAQNYNGIYTTTGEYSSPVGGSSIYGEHANTYSYPQSNMYEVGARYEEIHFGSTSSLLTERGEEPAGLVDVSGSQSVSPRGPQRVGPDTPPEDPYDGPLGDTPWLLMLLLALGYALRVDKKIGLRIPGTGK